MIVNDKGHRFSFYSCLVGNGINVQLRNCHVPEQVIAVHRHLLLQCCRDKDIIVYFMNLLTGLHRNFLQCQTGRKQTYGTHVLMAANHFYGLIADIAYPCHHLSSITGNDEKAILIAYSFGYDT